MRNLKKSLYLILSIIIIFVVSTSVYINTLFNYHSLDKMIQEIVGISLFIIIFIYKLLDIWFFKRVIFINYCVIKEWKVFGKIYFNKIKYKNLKVVIAKRGFIIKSFVFKNKKHNFFKTLFCFGVDLFLTKEANIEKMKDILIEKKY